MMLDNFSTFIYNKFEVNMNNTAKTYFQVLSIVSLVVGILFCLTILGCIIGVPLIIGSNKMREAQSMNEQQLIYNRTTLFAWGIFMAIAFSGSIVCLVLVLIFAIQVNDYILSLEKGVNESEKSFTENVKEGAQKIVDNVKDAFTSSKTKIDKEYEEISVKLSKLKQLKDEGLLSQEEYEKLRKEYVNKL